MTEHNHTNNNSKGEENSQSAIRNSRYDTGFDAAGRSLSEALRISFGILKVIMIVLVIIFLASGFTTVGSDERALVLRFGKIQGVGEGRVLGPGLRWILPYPIDEIVKIPVEKKPNLPIDMFWYIEKKGSLKNSFHPIYDGGYCITRSEKQTQTAGSAGSDYNIVHCKWQLTYKIDDPELFFRNIHIQDVKPGEDYFDVIKQSINPLLENMVADAVVTAMVNFSIDQAVVSQDRIPRHVEKLLQHNLDKIESGIKVVSVQLTDITWPRQVDAAFKASISASQESQKLISEAESYAKQTLNEAAGPVAEELLAALKNDSANARQKELLWSQLAGAAQGKIAYARAYRTRVVETAKANAEYLQEILPEYRKRPGLVIQKIYQDAIEYVLNNVDEKIIIQPTKGTRGRELRIILNRDPTIKPKSEE